MKANNLGWPMSNGKFINYPSFKKECWATDRQTYHGIAEETWLQRP
jgi:hypothetical protein